MFFNTSYAGAFNKVEGNQRVLPAPNLTAPASARPVLPAIAAAWRDSSDPVYYDGRLEIPDGMHPPAGFVPV